MPISKELPSTARAVYFAAIGTMICISTLLRRVARPLYPAVWALAGCLSLISILLAPSVAAIIDNLFVGAQLILLLGFGAFVLTYNAITDAKFTRRVGIAFLIGQSLSASVALAQQMGYFFTPAAVIYGRSSGLAGEKNALGLMTSIGVLISVQILLTSRKFQMFASIALAVNILSLISSGSLSAVLGLSIGLVVMFFCMRDYIGKAAIWGTAISVAIWIATRFVGEFERLPSLFVRYREVTGQAGGKTSWEDRKQTYDFSWNKITDDPVVGVGLNVRDSGTFDGIMAVHNYVLRAWYQGGIFLAIAFSLITIAIVIVVLQAMIRKETAGEAGILIAVLVFGAWQSVLEQRTFWLPILVAWASISATAATKAAPSAGATRPLQPTGRSASRVDNQSGSS